MLKLTVKAYSVFNEETDEFITVDENTVLKMENSLFAIAEWEKKYKKPWFPDKKVNPYAKNKDKEERTQEEMMYFIRCMVFKINDIPVDGPDDVDEKLIFGLTDEDFKKIGEYLGDSQTALKSIPETKPDKKHKSDPIKMTSDRIYSWIAEQQMPFSVEYWNINRLMNVIQIINYDNTPDDRKKRQKPFEVAQDYARINEERLKRLGTKG